MRRRVRIGGGMLGIACVLALALAGCASRVGAHWGEAQRENTARMVQNPEAEQAPSSPVEGLDGVTGEAVVGKYERGQKASREGSDLPSIIQISAGSER